MTIIILFSLLAIVALGASYLYSNQTALVRGALASLALFLFLFGIIIGSSVSIGNDEVGIVSKRFGPELPTGHIIARNGERGPQAKILGPGWHFGLLPFIYEVHTQSIITIEAGNVGVVSARDGQALPDGQTFAPSWSSVQDMLDAENFLTHQGYRGPQTTILTPGSYRFNPVLFEVKSIPALQVPAGSVAVIKSNTGRMLTPQEAAQSTLPVVNGVPLVAKEFRGIWAQALTPGAYYLNTEAYAPVMVKTTQRSYNYSATSVRPNSAAAHTVSASEVMAWAVTVRTRDGFTFPVDVRLICAVESSNASYLVALLGNPDTVVKDDQEDETLEVLEAKVVLPVIRAVMRNVAEHLTALEFVNSRSEIEKTATKDITAELARYKLTCDGVYVGQIHLDVTKAGQDLLATQTDKQVAENQQALYEQQKLAQTARAELVKATEVADQQKNLAAATFNVQVATQQAEAAVERAKGDAKAQEILGQGRAAAYKVMVETLGQNQVTQIELMKLVAEGKVLITPQVMVGAGASGNATFDALAGTILRQAANPPTNK
ncbi:MAG TPA: SPFH domain-containing protein [Candidatus Didemnitutus sp.]|nr:SPFH domain-containing protein [Candidatus Didemnitutus sp.]